MAGTDGTTREHMIEQLAEVHRLVCHGALAVRHQADGSAVRDYPEAEVAVRELQGRFEEQARELRERLVALGHVPDWAPTAATDGPPTGAPRASAVIDADHEFLQRLALVYLQLESAARSLGDRETASLGERGHRDIQYLIREQISRSKPRVAAADLAEPRPEPPGVVDRPTQDEQNQVTERSRAGRRPARARR